MIIRTRHLFAALGLGIVALAGCDGDATGSGDSTPTAVDAEVSSFRNQTVTVDIGAVGAAAAVPVSLVVPPAHGTLTGVPETVTGTTTVTYTPDHGFVGGDDFVYRVGSGAAMSTARVRISIRNRAPVATGMAATTIVATPVQIDLVATDPDGDSLTFEPFQQPARGTLGPVVRTGPASATLTYTPDAGYLGSDAFTFRASDGLEFSEPARVEIDVPAEIAAQPATVTTDEDRAVTFDLRVDNPGGVGVSFEITDLPVHGRLIGAILTEGAAEATSSARITYIPDPEYSGPDSFTFRGTTANGEPSSATVDLVVRPVNDPPSFTAGPDQVVTARDPRQVVENWATNISPGPNETFGESAGFRVFVDRPDLLSEPVRISLDGTLTYRPTAVRDSGVVEVDVELHDGDGAFVGERSFTIEVLPPPAPPQIAATFHQERFESKTGTSPALAVGPRRVRYAFVMEGYQNNTPDRGYSDFTIGGVSGTKLANEFAQFSPAEQISMFEVWRWRPSEIAGFSDLDYELTGGGANGVPRLVVFVDVVSVDPDVFERAVVSAENMLDLSVAAEPGDLVIDAYGLRSFGAPDLDLTYDSGQTERYYEADPLDDFDNPSSVIVGLAEKLATSTTEDLNATANTLTSPFYRIVIVVAQDDDDGM